MKQLIIPLNPTITVSSVSARTPSGSRYNVVSCVIFDTHFPVIYMDDISIHIHGILHGIYTGYNIYMYTSVIELPELGIS